MLEQRFQNVRPFEEMEISLVRAACARPDLVTPPEEAVLRTALSMARLGPVQHEGVEVDVSPGLSGFRDEVLRRLGPVLRTSRAPRKDALRELVPQLRARLLAARTELYERHANALPREAIDREIREKALVLVAGGGGGTGYVYLGVMGLLDEYGLKPRLMAGTSMGAILCLFRSRLTHFDVYETTNIVRGLSWRRLFRLISMENRYGLPAALRLFLRSGIGRYFDIGSEGATDGVRLSGLSVPMIVAVSGIRRGMLPRPLEFYEKLLSVSPLAFLDPTLVARKVQAAMSALAELFTRPELMVQVHLGLEEWTREFDALDAGGFSCALPGVIHYDVLREDDRMTQLLERLMEEKGVLRLFDGGLTDNLPAKAAWTAVQQGRIGTRNAFVLGLNAFSPKLSTPLWLPLERLAALTVDPNRPYAHLVKDFKRTLSPLELVPTPEQVRKAIDLGRAQLNDEIPFLCRMLAPLPAIH